MISPFDSLKDNVLLSALLESNKQFLITNVLDVRVFYPEITESLFE